MSQNPEASNALPEAPFSTNAYFLTTCGIKHQVTARGSSAHEMTVNYFAAVDSLKEAYAARANRQQIDAGKLLALVACWMHKAETISGMPMKLLKAAQLVQAGAVRVFELHGQSTYRVASQTQDGTWYTVQDGACSCEAYKHNNTVPCKHSLSCSMVMKLTAGA